MAISIQSRGTRRGRYAFTRVLSGRQRPDSRLTRIDGFLHRVLLWALSTLLTRYGITRGIGAVVGTTCGVVGRVAGTAAGALTNLGNDSAIKAQITDAFRQTGDPTLRPSRSRSPLDRPAKSRRTVRPTTAPRRKASSTV